MFRVQDLLDKYGEMLGLNPIAGIKGMQRPIKLAEVHRPGLGLSGYLKNYVGQRLLVFGNVEILYLKDLASTELRTERLKGILKGEIPAVIVAGRYRPPKELSTFC